MKGYNFGIRYYFEPVWMEDAVYVRVELVELMNGDGIVRVPENTVGEHEFIGGAESSPVLSVVVGEF